MDKKGLLIERDELRKNLKISSKEELSELFNHWAFQTKEERIAAYKLDRIEYALKKSS